MTVAVQKVCVICSQSQRPLHRTAKTSSNSPALYWVAVETESLEKPPPLSPGWQCPGKPTRAFQLCLHSWRMIDRVRACPKALWRNALSFGVVISEWWWHCPCRPPYSLADICLRCPCSVPGDEHSLCSLFFYLLSPCGDTPFSPKTEGGDSVRLDPSSL